MGHSLGAYLSDNIFSFSRGCKGNSRAMRQGEHRSGGEKWIGTLEQLVIRQW